MTLKELMAAVYQHPESLMFADVISAIDSEFDFTPSAFVNGELHNTETENQGSCKVLCFAHKAGMSEGHTLALFGEHYRDVLADPNGTGHANIRQFMARGWMGVSFAKPPLKKK
ncbi:MAG: HopJ type III effector protein [Reinekea sp.]|jgi:hypothetical protein|nr:HopJ type III effector protein [Reinekea sp.]MDX1472792.1 HopJ type III effector protein [Reinekea sp.]